ncbi:MAG: hypothetical protein QW104_06985, partial [Nitrososphaerota archaeon]
WRTPAINTYISPHDAEDEGFLSFFTAISIEGSATSSSRDECSAFADPGGADSQRQSCSEDE